MFVIIEFVIALPDGLAVSAVGMPDFWAIPANVELGEIQEIDYSWGEIDFVTKPMNEMRLMECTECEMSAPAAYDIDIEADDIDVTDTVTVVWEIF